MEASPRVVDCVKTVDNPGLLQLRYDGMRAAHGALAPSASKQVIAGGQVLLGGLGHYYLSGCIPDKINDTARGFSIEEISRIDGCRIVEFTIEISSSSLWEFNRVSFAQLAQAACRDWMQGRPIDQIPIPRREPFLTMPGLVNQAIFSLDPDDGEQRWRLYDRISDAMWQITAPVGSSCLTVDISIDGVLVGRHVDRQRTDELITSALDAMGARRPDVF